MSDTPRTDKRVTEIHQPHWGEHEIVDADFARILERESRLAGDFLVEERNRLLKLNEGRTHWRGCEKEHPICAALERFEAILKQLPPPNE